MKEVIIDTILDSAGLLPFLFIAFIIIELFEHKFTEKARDIILKGEKFGPIIGSIFGAVPQCGFSVAATNLYATRIISLGTLFAVYLSTSDEMVPIMIAEQAPINLIIKILIIKFLIGIFYGVLIDLFIKRKKETDYHICNDDHCDCEHSNLFIAALKHTIYIFIYIFIFTFFLNLIMDYGGIKLLEKVLFKNSVFAPFITSLIGLIPNCASSVVLTELYLKEAISFSGLIAGLLSGAGLAIIVLFKTNKSKKENFLILMFLYFIGVLSGIILEILLKLFT